MGVNDRLERLERRAAPEQGAIIVTWRAPGDDGTAERVYRGQGRTYTEAEVQELSQQPGVCMFLVEERIVKAEGVQGVSSSG